MEKNISVTLEKAREWYNSGNATLKDIALQAFDKDELTFNFKTITTFRKACEALRLNYGDMTCMARKIATFSRASAAMFKLNIIRKGITSNIKYVHELQHLLFGLILNNGNIK